MNGILAISSYTVKQKALSKDFDRVEQAGVLSPKRSFLVGPRRLPGSSRITVIQRPFPKRKPGSEPSCHGVADARRRFPFVRGCGIV